MAKKNRAQFLCNKCGAVQAKWLGKCPDCGEWNSLEEYRVPEVDARAQAAGVAEDFISAPAPLGEIGNEVQARLLTGIGEFDRVLGGGLVPGATVLVGGEPGIGKSTLMLQVASALAESAATRPGGEGRTAPILYVTSEESARQAALRASRLSASRPGAQGAGAEGNGAERTSGAQGSGAGGGMSANLLVFAESNVSRIIEQVRRLRPAVVVVDSIQMIYKPDLPAAPGSVTQLRDSCMDLVFLAKSMGACILFVGHVTKAGTLAGPKIIEHIVDTVVYFEGDRYHAHRIVRCVKNRFGNTHEVGLFEMTGAGLREVRDPGDLFIGHHGEAGPPSGCIIAAAMQGSRVILVEVQALTASSILGSAKRKVSGASADRVAMIIAVLEKRAELRLAADDVFVNVAGGVKVAEPAIDLPIALAIASAHLNRPLPARTFAAGELGLGGEIRMVSQFETRLREAGRLGCTTALVPRPPMRGGEAGGPPANKAPAARRGLTGEAKLAKGEAMTIHECRRLSDALGLL